MRTICRIFAASCFVFLATAFLSYCFFPGHASIDATSQYLMAVSGVFYDWHSYLYSIIWRWLLPLGAPSGGIFLFNTLVWTSAVWCFVRVYVEDYIGASCLGFLILIFPPFFMQSSLLQKETLFVGLGLWCITLLVRLSTMTNRHHINQLVVVLNVLIFAFGSMRHDALGSILVFYVWESIIIYRTNFIRANKYVSIFLISSICCIFFLLMSISSKALFHVKTEHPFGQVLFIDIACISASVGENLFDTPGAIPSAWKTEDFLCFMIKSRADTIHCSEVLINGVMEGVRVRDVLYQGSPFFYSELIRRWLYALISHPLVYFQIHAAILSDHLLSAGTAPVSTAYRHDYSNPNWTLARNQAFGEMTYPSRFTQTMQYRYLVSAQRIHLYSYILALVILVFVLGLSFCKCFDSKCFFIPGLISLSGVMSVGFRFFAQTSSVYCYGVYVYVAVVAAVIAFWGALFNCRLSR